MMGATFEIYTPVRYYTEEYPRGPWPILCGVLMSLFASNNVDKIWYLGENGIIGRVEPLTVDDVLDISRFYMANGQW